MEGVVVGLHLNAIGKVLEDGAIDIEAHESLVEACSAFLAVLVAVLIAPDDISAELWC